jgi:hypothetical protein
VERRLRGLYVRLFASIFLHKKEEQNDHCHSALSVLIL